ncbi:MAG: hypothetical protein LBU64_14685 [Planctomycetota bacterium]|jgi:hypothetical protein|nr:hypothetical protein [Planctomycetota bacterium]
MAKALLLLSGGLDSTLAGKILLEMGVRVEAVNFTSPFCRCTPKSFGCLAARSAADFLGIPVRVLAKGDDYLEVVKHPRHGRGRGMNPCLDCRIYTFRRARELLGETGSDFVATGEVLGQRPMSQRGDAMSLIERESGLAGLVVRPLSARLLPPSLPEQNGWLDRERLLAIQGRSRRDQISLARNYDLNDYPCPAGGCLLTDPEFAARLRDLLEHDPGCDFRAVRLLSLGRHFRLAPDLKAVVGRNQGENLRLEAAAGPGDWLLAPAEEVSGPTVLLCRAAAGAAPDADSDPLAAAGGLLALHCREGRRASGVDLELIPVLSGGSRGGKIVRRGVAPVDSARAEAWRVGRGNGKPGKPGGRSD